MRIQIIMNEMKVILKRTSKKISKNFDLENLRTDQKYGYLHETVQFLDEDING
jgi:hypothetical protein